MLMIFYSTHQIQFRRNFSKLFSRIKLRLPSWPTVNTYWEQLLDGLITRTATYHFTYAYQNLHHIASLPTPSMRCQTWLIIDMVIPSTQFLLLIILTPIFPTKIKYITSLLAVSIVFLPAPALILLCHSHLLHITVMLPIHSTTRPPSILWSI